MEKNEYECAKCGNIYEKINSDEWSDEMASNEFKENFPGFDSQNVSIVCDSCYNELMANRK